MPSRRIPAVFACLAAAVLFVPAVTAGAWPMPAHDIAKVSPLTGTTHVKPECPASLRCDWVPAAYQRTRWAEPGSYGNYDVADRPRDVPIRYIVLHDTEEDYASTLRIFQDPKTKAAAHYVVRSADGQVTQMVRTKDVGWHSGNWYINSTAIGIEQEGYADQGATWYTPEMYRSTARLVRYLAARYHIPLDRQHILGHDNVPASTASGIKDMHWDPGPYWDWGRFFALLGKPITPTAHRGSELVTINPVFRQNVQQLRDCPDSTYNSTGPDLPDQSADLVPLRTAPAADAPLFADPGLHTDGKMGSDCITDWGSRASTGQQFVVAEQRGEWTAIWWAGAKAWFRNPARRPVAVPTQGLIVKPKPGRREVPTYGRAYPEASAYPQTIDAQPIEPLPYTLAAGQAYAYGGPTPTGYYYAKTIDDSLPDDHTYVAGKDRYLTIQLGHRIAFVRASDVDVVRAGRHGVPHRHRG